MAYGGNTYAEVPYGEEESSGSVPGVELGGTVSGSSSVVGTLLLDPITVRGTTAGSSTVTGTLATKSFLTAAVAGFSSVYGNLLVVKYSFSTVFDPDDANSWIPLQTKARKHRAIVSANLREATPDTPDIESVYLRPGSVSSANVVSLLDIEHGVPLGVQADVLKAELHLFKAETWSNNGNLTVYPITGEWDADQVTWNTTPDYDVSRSSVITVPTGGDEGDEQIVDVTAIVASLVAEEEGGGASWNGLLLTLSGTAAVRKLWSSNTRHEVRPYLEVEYNTPPSAPDNLRPGGLRKVSKTKPVLRGDFFDSDAKDVMSHIQVQVSTDETFDTTHYDSGQVAHSEARFDTDDPPTGAPAMTALTTNTTYYWRMKVWDSRGLPSDWSDTESFRVKVKGSITITNPAGSTVSSPTPTFTHTLTSLTQEQIEVIVEVLEQDVWNEHYAFEPSVRTDLTHTLPDAYRLEEGEEYRLTIRVWDDDDREDMADDRNYVIAQQEFTLTAASVTGP